MNRCHWCLDCPSPNDGTRISTSDNTNMTAVTVAHTVRYLSQLGHSNGFVGRHYYTWCWCWWISLVDRRFCVLLMDISSHFFGGEDAAKRDEAKAGDRRALWGETTSAIDGSGVAATGAASALAAVDGVAGIPST